MSHEIFATHLTKSKLVWCSSIQAPKIAIERDKKEKKP